MVPRDWFTGAFRAVSAVPAVPARAAVACMPVRRALYPLQACREAQTGGAASTLQCFVYPALSAFTKTGTAGRAASHPPPTAAAAPAHALPAGGLLADLKYYSPFGLGGK